MTLPTSPTPSESTEKVGRLEGALLGVLGVMGVLVVGSAVVLSIVAIAVGDGQIGIFTK